MLAITQTYSSLFNMSTLGACALTVPRVKIGEKGRKLAYYAGINSQLPQRYTLNSGILRVHLLPGPVLACHSLTCHVTSDRIVQPTTDVVRGMYMYAVYTIPPPSG